MALRSVWKSPCCECPAGHRTAGLWRPNRESKRGAALEGLEEENQTWGFNAKQGFVWNVFCVMRCPNSALWISVTWSLNLNISLRACTPQRRLFSAEQNPTPPHFKSIWPSVLADLVIRLVVGVISETPLGDVFSSWTCWHRALVMLLSLCSQTAIGSTRPSAVMSTQCGPPAVPADSSRVRWVCFFCSDHDGHQFCLLQHRSNVFSAWWAPFDSPLPQHPPYHPSPFTASPFTLSLFADGSTLKCLLKEG